MEKIYSIPYSNEQILVSLPEEQVDFVGTLNTVNADPNWQNQLYSKLDNPDAGPALSTLLSNRHHVVILVEDNTRHTPVKKILPLLCKYLVSHGCPLKNQEILIAPGTHRTLTEEELREKLGDFAMQKIKVSQHDFNNTEDLIQLDDIYIDNMRIPVMVNRIAVDADLLIGLGNIIPHPNAGYSGGAKILDPGCCGRETVSATHAAAALMGYLPLGMEENECRDSIEKVATKVGLDFIINVVLNENHDVIGVVTGDLIKAHRAGVKIAKKVFGVSIKNLADIVISSSYPYDIDYWQCEKALISAYFAVKKGGIIIFVAPCKEGIAHNHDDFIEWLKLDSKELENAVREIGEGKRSGDLIAAGIALGAAMVREKADIYIYTTGLSKETIKNIRYTYFENIQDAINAALIARPGGSIGILPRGGDCIPYIAK